MNSDDPAYFGAYVNQNLAAAQQAAALTVAELAQLARNSFQIAWLTPADRAPLPSRPRHLPPLVGSNVTDPGR